MRKIGTVIPEVLREVATDDRAALVFLDELWRQLVGRELAARTKPHALEGKVLTVLASDALWAQEVANCRDMVRDSINDFWGLQLVERIEIKSPSAPKA